MTDNSLSSTRPYLLRAMHEWMSDNHQTPLVVVDAEGEGVVVPSEHVKDGRIVLNIAWAATRDLLLDNDGVSFQARFGGVPHTVTLPMNSVQGIYARESGQGMVFQDEPGSDKSADGLQGVAISDGDNDHDPEGPKPRPNGPNLRIVK